MKKPSEHQRRIEFLRRLDVLKNDALNLGLFRTLHELNAAMATAGGEVAEKAPGGDRGAGLKYAEQRKRLYGP